MTLQTFVNTAVNCGYSTRKKAREWAKRSGKTVFTDDDFISLYHEVDYWYSGPKYVVPIDDSDDL